MIRHIVAFDLAATDAAERALAIRGIRERLEPLIDVIPGVLSIEVGEDEGGVSTHWPLVLVSEHADLPALQSYQVHPAHQEALAWINTVVVGRAVVDYSRK